MWQNNDFSMSENAEGGFLGTDSPGKSGKKDGQVKRSQSVTPVVIGMLKKCKKEEFKMWGMPTHILKIVGIMKRFNATSTKVTYLIEDHTGRMKAILWLEQESSAKDAIPVDKENSYLRIYGTLRKQRNEKLLMILKIQPIDFMNEITTHQLEVIHTRFMSEKLSRGESLAIKRNNPGAELTNSMMTFTNTNRENNEEDNMTVVQLKIFRFIKTATSKVGVSRSAIHQQFPQFSHREVSATLEFLSGEGHVFSTIDNDHFKQTD